MRPLKKCDTKAVTDILEDWFLDHGKPVSIRTDVGPQFRGPFKAWCDSHNIEPELSSAFHHESNGHAECAVREMKKLLGKTNSLSEFRKALLEYRNTPRFDGPSPAQWYRGRRQRKDAAALPIAYDLITDARLAKREAQREEKMVKHQSCANRSSRPRTLMEPGQRVVAQNMKTQRWDQQATIIEKWPNGRSYVVNIDGQRRLRNRRFLRPSPVLDQADSTRPVATTELSYEVAKNLLQPRDIPNKTDNLGR